MTAPIERKSLKVSPDIHRAVYDLARQVGGSRASADTALIHLLSGVHVHLSDIQRQRWTAYAEASGISLEQWVILRVEAAIQYGCDLGSMHAALDHLRAITGHLGIEVTRTAPPRPRPATEGE